MSLDAIDVLSGGQLILYGLGFLTFYVVYEYWSRRRERSSWPSQEMDALRDDEFLRLYAGQEGHVGSKNDNDEIRATLIEQGADLSVPVMVYHQAKAREIEALPGGKAQTGVNALARELQARGFKPQRPEPGNLALVFGREDKITSMVFDKRTMDLNDFLFEHGWNYGGWGLAANWKDKDE